MEMEEFKMLKAKYRNAPITAVFVFALAIAAVGANAAGVLNTSSGGYVFCFAPKSKIASHPTTSTCPKGYQKLILGARGLQGIPGLQGIQGIQGIQGPTGVTGAAGLKGSNILQGITTLTNEMGVDGDFYFNSALRIIYGPKKNGSWPEGVNLSGGTGATGPAGPAGATGATGATGAAGSSGSLSCAQGGTCAIGNTGPGGGIVFYISTTPNTAATPWKYLEVAPTNTWSGGVADPTLGWCSNTSTYVASLATGATTSSSMSTLVGKGFFNTKMMLGNCTFGAANMAASYNGGGKSDWFLPSMDELNQLCKWDRGLAWTSDATVCSGGSLNSATFGASSAGLAASGYLASTESSTNALKAWTQNLGTGAQLFADKTFTAYGIRPIRAF